MAIFEDREAFGITYPELCKKYGLSMEEVEIIVAAQKPKWYNQRIGDIGHFSIRALNIFFEAGLTDRNQVIAAYANGKFDPRRSGKLKNCGWLTFQEIAKCLGYPDPEKRKRELALKYL